MARKITFETQFKQLWNEYEQVYDLSSLNSANDKENLTILIRNQVIIRTLQDKINSLMEDTDTIVENIEVIKKLSDSVRDAIGHNTKLEAALAIDRKTRKNEQSIDDPATYILGLKRAALDFLEKRLIKVYCPDCKVLVGRIGPAHEHTRFETIFFCSQCNKPIKTAREERDVLFDIPVKDREWRKKHTITIKPPKKSNAPELLEVDDDIVLGAQDE